MFSALFYNYTSKLPEVEDPVNIISDKMFNLLFDDVDLIFIVFNL